MTMRGQGSRRTAVITVVGGLIRRPVFTGLAVGLIALAVGAVTAIFSVLNTVLLRPLPYREPDALYALNEREPVGDSSTQLPLTPMQLTRWRSESRAFESVEGYTPATMKLTGDGEPAPLDGAVVSAGLFDLLGWHPLVGRTFTRSEEIDGSGVVMISHGLWLRRFGGDPRVIGRVMVIDDVSRVVIGIMPPRFSMMFQKVDVWTPMSFGPDQLSSPVRMIAAIGRLRAGSTFARAVADLDGIDTVLSRERPDDYRLNKADVVPLREWLFGNQRGNLLVLLAAVLLLLAIAIVNVLSLTFADSIAGQGATKTRLALGAGAANIVARRVSESVVIGIFAAVVGLGLGRLGLAALQMIAPDALVGFGAITFDRTVLVIGSVLALLAALAAGVPAGLRESRLSTAGLAGSATKSLGGRSDRRLSDVLLIAQVALTVLILVSAALVSRNLRSLLHKSAGFDPQHVLVVEMTMSHAKYVDVSSRSAYLERLIESIRPLPGVEAVASIQTRFVLGETWITKFDIEGRPAEPGLQLYANIRHTTPDILGALRIHLRSGRAISATDRIDGPPVAMISESFSRRFMPGMDPLGHRIKRVTRPERPWMEIVGVVDDITDSGAGVEIGPTIWVSYLQQNTPTARTTLVARTNSRPAAFAPAIRRAIWSVDPNQTIDAITPLEDLMLRSAAQPRFEALVTAMLAGASLLLVLSGIYSLTLHAVFRRTREVGLRAALGSPPARLVSSILRQSLAPVAMGVVIGAALSIPASRAMQRLLNAELTTADLPLFIAVVTGAFGCAALASYLPARRVLAIPPSLAMRASIG